jgi:hypothetical protein
VHTVVALHRCVCLFQNYRAGKDADWNTRSPNLPRDAALQTLTGQGAGQNDANFADIRAARSYARGQAAGFECAGVGAAAGVRVYLNPKS